MPRIDLDRSLLRASLLLASTDSTRVYHGVHVISTATDTFYCATDGHVAIVTRQGVPHGQEPLPPITVPYPVVKGIKASKTYPNLELQGPDAAGCFLLGDSATGATISFLRGSFPNLSEVIPSPPFAVLPPEAPRPHFDFALLAKFAAFADKVNAGMPLVWPQDEYSPALVTFTESQDTWGVVMPRAAKGHTCPTERPEWFAAFARGFNRS